MDLNTNKISFSESVYRPGSEAGTFYKKAKGFVENNFKGEKDTVITNDKTNTITYKGAFFYP
ncbi:hypothetical protein SAE01_00080 [Segetibacter aerophilus]|uniref:Uncharacterized protein n=2 Tax=Segetibacter aerophilus TaxID=670293 RepID=A0A512B6C7_9BACT|nr:hypothetical protein SAE01_00080 [Segetibacter aerophilus]